MARAQTLRGEVVGRRFVIGVELELAFDELHAFVFELLAVADFSGVGSATAGVVDWGRRR